jgi:acetyl-CoA carboxylase beta subunit|tara:strand:- start:7456 stop:7641 length:186 start_codon:yes stop_codon:yes gene_type:complete
MGKNKKVILEFTMCPNCAKNVLPDHVKNEIYVCPECDELFQIVEEIEIDFEADFDIEPTIH